MEGKGKKILVVFMSVCGLLNSGCKSIKTQPAYYPTSIEEIHQNLQNGIANDELLDKRRHHVPASVSHALMPKLESNLPMTAPNAEHRFDISADKMPAKTFFMGLVEGTNTNMVVNPNVNGFITLTLKNVTIHEAMQAVRDVYGYQFRRTAYGYEVLPEELQTQIFNVNYLDMQRKGKSYTEISSGQISDKVTGFSSGSSSSGGLTGTQSTTSQAKPSGSSVDTTSEMNFWKDLKTTLSGMVGDKDGRSVVVNSEGGVVIVRAFPSQLRQISRYLDRIQTSINRQVILEAKVLEVQLNNEYQAGIDWNMFGKGQQQFIDPITGEAMNDGGTSQTALKTFDRTDLKDFTSIFTLNIKGDFGSLIKLLQTQGNVQVLSSPRISTVNNQKAVFKVGQDEFFVTGVSTSNYIASNTTIPTQDVSLTPFFSGVTLDVTPQISKKGEIILHIHPSISTVKEQTKSIVLGSTQTTANATGVTPNTLVLPLALSTIRESDNVVRARNGQIIVIGGLIQNNMQEQIAGVPWASRLPFIGTFFRRTFQQSVKSELVILLRPVLADNRAFKKDMTRTDKRFYGVDRGYHFGGYPEIFGTQGEREPSDVCRSF